MVDVNYENLTDRIQNTIYNAINDNITTSKVIDGLPQRLLDGLGLPYTLVNTPTVLNSKNASASGISGSVRHTIRQVIIIYSFKESVARKLSDSVRHNLRDNVDILRADKIFGLVNSSTDYKPEYHPVANKPIHIIEMTYDFKVTVQ